MIERPVMRGKRINLRLLEEVDLSKRVEYFNDPDINATLNVPVPVSYAETRAWFSKLLLNNSRRDFSIFLNDTDELIGFCGLTSIDTRHRKAELYMLVGASGCDGKGYGRDANMLLGNFAFIELGLQKLYSYQLISNDRAIRSKEVLGWNRDGVLRKDVFTHGVFQDRATYSLLREDWVANDVYQNV